MNFSKANIPLPVIKLIETLNTKGFEGWIVGGAIRGLLLSQIPKDWDVTTNATPDQVQKVFPHTIETGISYGTVTVVLDSMHIQVTTFRKEGAYENHRKPKEVSYCQNLLEDLSRRDFTMNAIAYNPVQDDVQDPFDGVHDIEHQWIKAVGDPQIRFQEDALRILRALRFQSQLGFSIEDPTLQAMSDSSSLLSTLSRERIQEEFSKWLLGDNVSMTLPTAKQINFFKIFDITPDDGFFAKWDQIGTISPTLLFRLTAFFDLYFGSDTPENKKNNSLKLLKSLRYGQQSIDKVIQFIEFLSLPADLDIKAERLLWIKKALRIEFNNAIDLLNWKLEKSDNKPLILKQKNILMQLKKRGFEQQVYPLAIDGNKIMQILHLSPGSHIKTLLNELEDYVLENPNKNTSSDLEAFIQKKI